MIRDPIFLELIKKLREAKPQNYRYREVDLYNDGKDAYQQEIITTGNMLQIFSFTGGTEVYICFNEMENPIIKLEPGIILFTFYRFFLTYKHTKKLDAYNNRYLLRMLIGKDLISIQYPTPIEKNSLTLVEGQTFEIPYSEMSYILPCEFASQKPFSNSFDIRKYNQLRGIVGNQTIIDGENYFCIRQYFLYDNIYQIGDETKIELPDSFAPTPFFVDIIAPYLQFYVTKTTQHELVLYLYAKAWCL